MTTPKQKRLRKREQPGTEAEFPPVLDQRFDEPSQADQEFTRWRFPERDDA